MARRLVMSGIMRVQDYEYFADNETEMIPFSKEAYLNDNEQPQQVLEVEEGTGGEIRTLLEVDAQLLNSGNIRVEGSITLYEGTSESTTDFGGEKHFSFIVPKGGTSTYKTTVRNVAEDEPDDFARLSFTCKNRSG